MRSSFGLRVLPASFLRIFLSVLLFMAPYHITQGFDGTEVGVPPGNVLTTFQWGFANASGPLLSLPDRVGATLDYSLTYPGSDFGFPLLQAVTYSAARDRYALLIAPAGRVRQLQYVELARDPAQSTTYRSVSAPSMSLEDTETGKVLHTFNGTSYIFAATPEGELRWTEIQDKDGSSIHARYSESGLMEEISDGLGRRAIFHYSGPYITSITQTWSLYQVGEVRTWEVIGYSNSRLGAGEGTGVGVIKRMPVNAVFPAYTPEMAASDRKLAQVFGGPEALAAGNSFEPAGLGSEYPIYRGDIISDTGSVLPGHLSTAVHIYGSMDGSGDTDILIPEGFSSHSAGHSPTDAAVTFYYPALGNEKNVTLAVFHVADFRLEKQGDRVRIGRTGGRGGSSLSYRHAHIEIYRGNTGGIPSVKERERLGIKVREVFA